MAVPSHARHEAKTPQARAAHVESAPPAARNAEAVLALQRAGGNRAVSQLLARDPGSLISTAELTTNWRRAQESRPWSARQPGTVFRLPTAASIKAMMAAGEVPEDKIKDSIATALTRMQREPKGTRLKTTDAIPDIMKRLFPAPGKFDEAEFAKVVDVADRSKIYERAVDAEAKLTAADKTKLITAIGRADLMLDDAIADDGKIKLVFGTKSAQAKANYVKAKAALAKLKGKIDTNVHTDYNRDDEQVSLGGWAQFSTQMVHLEPDVAAGKHPIESALTILHESAHLASASVKDDGGYYPPSATKSAGWEAMTDDEKLNNAAHYEEVPRRQLGNSVFKPDQEFKPGISASTGGAVTFETEIRLAARQHLRMAWDAAVDTHLGIRKVRVAIEKGSTASFTANEALIIEISEDRQADDPRAEAQAAYDRDDRRGAVRGRRAGDVGDSGVRPQAGGPGGPRGPEDQAGLRRRGRRRRGQGLRRAHRQRRGRQEAARLDGRPLPEGRPVTESVVFGDEAVPVDAESVERANEPIGDLEPLRRLTRLRELRLVRTNPHRRVEHFFEDLEPLRALSNLEVVELAHAPVDDLSPLAGLTYLRRLDLSHSRVSDLSPLAALTDLRRLDLSHSQVSDLSPLRALTALEHLDVAWTPVADLEALRELARLEALDVSGTQVVDLTPLRALRALCSFECRDTAVIDLGPLAQLTALEVLRVAGANVEDLAPLAGLHALRELDLAGTRVRDLGALAGLSELRLLVLVGTPVGDDQIEQLPATVRVLRG